jgi:superfamily II helicase
VLVCAPTGAGKTVVGEFAVHLALAAGQKCFYTTPIKALSNQKHSDLVRRYGPERIGLLTGDQSINGDAPVVVMTTEVLRNMLYAGSETLGALAYVVMDEVHFLADRMRGAVWEEVILHLPYVVYLIQGENNPRGPAPCPVGLAHAQGQGRHRQGKLPARQPGIEIGGPHAQHRAARKAAVHW